MTGARVDLHVKILDDEVVRRAKEAGLDVLVYAPHFTRISTIRERAKRYTDDDLLVVPAREYFTGPWNDRRHVLAIDPDEPLPDFLPFEATMAELETQDATVLAPHPEFLTMSLSREDIGAYDHLFDAVEVYCPKNRWFQTRRAKTIATETGLTPFVSSYAHLSSTIGQTWVEYDREIERVGDLVAAIESDDPPKLYRKGGVSHTIARTCEFVHLFRENTWDKFERIVLEGIEETNPAQPAYGGRFEDFVQ